MYVDRVQTESITKERSLTRGCYCRSSCWCCFQLTSAFTSPSTLKATNFKSLLEPSQFISSIHFHKTLYVLHLTFFAWTEFVWEMSTSDDYEGLAYWVRWQVPVCALIFTVPAVVAVKFIKKLKAEPLNHTDLWIPCWRNLNPLWLLVYRAFAFVCLAWVLYEVFATIGGYAFYFYTQ